jgi:hypothetical protein
MAFGDIPSWYPDHEDLPRLTSSEWVCCPSLNKCVNPTNLCPDSGRMAIYFSEADCKAAGPPCGPLRPTSPTSPPDSLDCWRCVSPARPPVGDIMWGTDQDGEECVPASCDSPGAYVSNRECTFDCYSGHPRTEDDWALSYECVMDPLTGGVGCQGRDDLNGEHSSISYCMERCKLVGGHHPESPPRPPQPPEFGRGWTTRPHPGAYVGAPGGPSTGV